MSTPRVAIIGGGISGLTCASSLNAEGVDVCVFDQGYRVGGRTSTRTTLDGRVIADHGAPVFEAHDPAFRSAVTDWIEAGVCTQWEGVCVGTPRMDAASVHLGQGIMIHTSTRIQSIQRGTDQRWSLRAVDKAGNPIDADFGGFDHVVLATHPREALRLIDDHSESLAEISGSITMAPMWVLMVTLEDPLDGLDTIIDLPDDRTISRIIRDDHKPGRARIAGQSTLVAHASLSWSETRNAMERDEAAALLTDAVLARISELLDRDLEGVRIESAIAHRWGSAFPTSGVSQRSAQDTEAGLTVCGDWFGWDGLHRGVEAAWLSGRDAAESIEKMLRDQ